MTNFEKIKSLDVEELAAFLCKTIENPSDDRDNVCAFCDNEIIFDGFNDMCSNLCVEGHIKWLNKEVADD